MADVKETMKNAWVKGMEAIGNAATSIANGTKTKVKEINLVSRRTEIFSDLSSKVYELWQKGETLPAELTAMLQELADVDEALSELRAERIAEAKIAEEKSAAGAVPTIDVKEPVEEEAAEEAPEQMEDQDEETVAYKAADDE